MIIDLRAGRRGAELEAAKCHVAFVQKTVSVFRTPLGRRTAMDGHKKIVLVTKKMASVRHRDYITAVEDTFDQQIRLNRTRCRLEYYQRDGVMWMRNREGVPLEAGGIVADEMGLGKTIMSLALIHASLPDKGPRLPSLVIVPLAVVEQWKAEAMKFVGIDALIVSVASLRRSYEHEEIVDGRTVIVTRPNPAYISLDEIASSDLVIAPHSCFNVASIDYDDHALLTAPFRRVIVDEAHVIKNQKAHITRNIARVQATFRWCLTGTPIVTKKNDMCALLSFVTCGNWPVVEAIMGDPARRAAAYMRRTKEDIGARVPRLECVRLQLNLQIVEFSDVDRAAYAARYRYAMWRMANSEPREKRKWLLKTITDFRLLAARCPAKNLALVELFRNHAPGTRSLIFCNYIDEINNTMAALRASGTVDVVMPYVGKMNPPQRSAVIDAFMGRSPQSMALVVQIQAGGQSLNLQAASRVYILSPFWNATTEMQAIARAHRTGTTHVVEVTRFVVRNTVEEYMHTLQQEKLLLAAGTLEDDRLKDSLTAHVSLGGSVTWSGKIFDGHSGDDIESIDDEFGEDDSEDSDDSVDDMDNDV